MTITEGTFHVFTFKDGLLARLAHDLRLTLERFELTVDGDEVSGRFWPASLRVDGVMSRGQLKPRGISDGDKRKIQGNINQKILHTGRYPEISFEGQGTPDGDDAWRVQGALKMMGREAPVSLRVTRRGGRYQGEVELTPTRWGIQPYKALAGAIKLQDRLKVSFELTAKD